MSTTDWSALRPGDPMPTVGHAHSGDPMCGLRFPDWTCTRTPHTDSAHVASIGDVVAAVLLADRTVLTRNDVSAPATDEPGEG